MLEEIVGRGLEELGKGEFNSKEFYGEAERLSKEFGIRHEVEGVKVADVKNEAVADHKSIEEINNLVPA